MGYSNRLSLSEKVKKICRTAYARFLLRPACAPFSDASRRQGESHAESCNREQAVAELVACDDPWLKMSLEVELGECLEHPNPLLRETARAAKLPAGTRRQLLNLRGLMQITHAPESAADPRKKRAPLRRQHSSGA